MRPLESLCPIFVYQGVFVILTIGVLAVWVVPLDMIVILTIGVVTVWVVPLGMIVLNVLDYAMLQTVVFMPKLDGINHTI